MSKLQRIPSVNKLLETKEIKALVSSYNYEFVLKTIREELDRLREFLKVGKEVPESSVIIQSIENSIDKKAERTLKRVVNATGIIIHTNLGRAPLSKRSLEELSELFENYSNLEFDLKTGMRGHRSVHTKDLICELTGAEDAIIVNNNASAVYMILKVLAKDKGVLISRGELVEIGGSFRIPDIMSASGAKMVEVGTTNRTHLKDYEQNIDADTAMIFKAHTSNYKIVGFTKEVPEEDIADLAKKKGVIFVHDVGSGYLKQIENPTLKNEPLIIDALANGADLVCFSGDKLLGGAQAGIIVGKKELIQKLNKSPMMRVLRVGKVTLSLLNSALLGYLKEKELSERVPVMRYLQRSDEEQKRLAETLAEKLSGIDAIITVEKCIGFVGGGSVPEEELQTWQVAIADNDGKRQKMASIHKMLMLQENPIVGLMDNGRLVFKTLTLEEVQLDIIAQEMKKIWK